MKALNTSLIIFLKAPVNKTRILNIYKKKKQVIFDSTNKSRCYPNINLRGGVI